MTKFAITAHGKSNRILLALLTLALMTGTSSAQQRTHYDPRGNVVSRSATDSSDTTTNYEHDDVYDARGRNVGRFTTSH